MRNNIRNLIFDWGNVLIDVTMTDFKEACQEAGIKFTDEEVNSTHKAVFFLDFELGKITEKDFRNEIRKRSVSPLKDNEIDLIWNRMLGSIPEKKLNFLFKIKNQYKLYLLSNTNSIHWNTFSKSFFKYKDYNLLDSFSGFYLSYQQQCAKPDPGIFEKAIRESKIDINETLFIDDSKKNCETAQTLGMKVLNYLPTDDLESRIMEEIEK